MRLDPVGSPLRQETDVAVDDTERVWFSESGSA